MRWTGGVGVAGGAGGAAADVRGDTGGGVPPEAGDGRVCVCSGREEVAARRWTGGWAPVGVPGRPVGAEGRFAGRAGSAASPEEGGGVTWAAARWTGAVGVLGAGPSAGAPAGVADERAGGASTVRSVRSLRSVRWTGDAGREAPAAGVGAGADEDAGAGDDAAGPRAARCTGRSDAALPLAGADGLPGAGAAAGAGAVRGGVLDAGAVPESGPAADTARCTGSSPAAPAGAAPARGTARWAGAGAEPGAGSAGLRDGVSPSAPERETGGPRPARGRVARWTGGPGGAESGAVGRRSPEGAGGAAGAEAARAVGAGPEGGVAARPAAAGVPLPDSCALRCTGVPDDEAGRFRTGAGAGAGAGAVPGSPAARCPDVPDGGAGRFCARGGVAAPEPGSRVVRCTGAADGDVPRP
ncbi:hypothetical protein ACWEWK_17090 [Streptomyces sp. NPDC003757]